jgi:hypothetical protein
MFNVLFILINLISLFILSTSLHSSSLNCIINELNNNNFQGKFDYNQSSNLYQNITDIDNGRCSVNPLIILFPLSDLDISISIKTSIFCNEVISVISGGHSAAGYSLVNNGITISLSKLNKIKTNLITGIIAVESGTIFKDVYRSVYNTSDDAMNTNWTPIGGGCPYVGVGGFFLGGGWSFLSRSYGLAIDLLIEFTVVLSNGDIMIVNSSNECNNNEICRELWWANRGGGGGNFGIVTNYKFQMKKTPDEILIGQLCWEPDTPLLSNIWGWLLDVYPTLPDWIQIDSGWLPLGDDNTRLFCHTVICNNNNESSCYDFIQPVIDIGSIVYNDLKMQPFLQWQIDHDSITSAQHGNLYLSNVMLDDNVCSVEVILKIQTAIINSPSSRNLVITHMGGGAISRINNEDTAFPHRKSQFVLQMKAIWSSNSTVESIRNINWVEELKSWLDKISTGSYVNYIDPYLINWEKKYYTTNLPRLQNVKKLVDPNNIFHFNQSISVGL